MIVSKNPSVGAAALAARLIPVLDLTSLNDARDDDIAGLCAKAITPQGPVAAVCSWAGFAAEMKHRLEGAGPRVAVVVNFPDGDDSVSQVAEEAAKALAAGADELDLVFPYRAWLAGEAEAPGRLIGAVKAVAGPAPLKVILEVGALGETARITAAGRLAIEAGADFLKTSTGKIAQGATVEAAQAMLGVIRETGASVGLKVSGGIRTPEDAAPYLALVDEAMGAHWLVPARFRIGASRLLEEALAVLVRAGTDA